MGSLTLPADIAARRAELERTDGATLFGVVGSHGDIELSVTEARALIGELGQFVVENTTE